MVINTILIMTSILTVCAIGIKANNHNLRGGN